MLSPAGRLMGDLTVTRLSATRFWLIGSYYLQEWHLRWFNDHLPKTGVTITNLSESWLGFSLSGPQSRRILASLTQADVSNRALPFMSCQMLDVGLTQAVVARLSLTGELGYEITVPASQQRALWQALMDAGTPIGMKPIGMRAQDSLRLEKAYGVWSLEFSASYTPAMCGLQRFIDFNKGEFIGREAALQASKTTPDETLVLLSIDALDADVTGYEPIYHQGVRIGYVTSGCYGHHVQQSLALAYVNSTLAHSTDDLSVIVVGEPRRARILQEPPYDPKALKLRS
jgi:dimethylglycine dehydrogenase